MGDAAGGVAAGGGLGAVGVPEIDAHPAVTRADHRELIEADAAVAVPQTAHEPGRHRLARLRTGIDHDEVVAEAMYLAEPERAGAGGIVLHRALYTGGCDEVPPARRNLLDPRRASKYPGASHIPSGP